MSTPPCNIDREHCESCGSTDREDLTTGDQGYTACCNELVTERASCRGHHEDPVCADCGSPADEGDTLCGPCNDAFEAMSR